MTGISHRSLQPCSQMTDYSTQWSGNETIELVEKMAWIQGLALLSTSSRTICKLSFNFSSFPSPKVSKRPRTRASTPTMICSPSLTSVQSRFGAGSPPSTESHGMVLCQSSSHVLSIGYKLPGLWNTSSSAAFCFANCRRKHMPCATSSQGWFVILHVDSLYKSLVDMSAYIH